MSKSSRHKSSKHSSREGRDYSDSEKDTSLQERKSKEESVNTSLQERKSDERESMKAEKDLKGRSDSKSRSRRGKESLARVADMDEGKKSAGKNF